MATSWTDPTLSTSIKVKAVHITQLQTAVYDINQADIRKVLFQICRAIVKIRAA